MANVTLSASASPSGWRTAIQTGTLVHPNHQITCSVSGDSWAIITRYLADDDFWLIGLDASGNPIVEKWNGSTFTTVASSPETYSGDADIVVEFRQIRYGKDYNIWDTVTMWWNGKRIISYIEYAYSAIINQKVSIGLAVINSTSMTFENLRVPELGDIAEVVTLDEGESTYSGLQRAIQNKDVRHFIRFNNAFRAYRPKAQSAAYTIPDMERLHFEYNREVRASHIKMIGAYDRANYVDTDAISEIGHVIRQLQNPNLMNEYACIQEAQRAMIRLNEESIRESVAFGLLHFIESGDRMIANGNDRTITGIQVRQTPVKTEMQLTMKGYGHG